jgi:hypothetical protein
MRSDSCRLGRNPRTRALGGSMIRKIGFVAVAALVPFGLFALSPSAASAMGLPASVDVTNATVRCGTVSGTVTFSPAVHAATWVPAKMRVKASLANCSSSSVPTVFSGKMSGVLNFGLPTEPIDPIICHNILVGGDPFMSGALAIRWHSTEPLSVSHSAFIPGAFYAGGEFGGDPVTSDGSQYYHFAIGFMPFKLITPTSTVTGAFQGSDNGQNSLLHIVTSEELGLLNASCGSVTGLKSMTIGLGSIELK